MADSDVQEPRVSLDAWRLAGAVLWMFFFMLGLQPDNTFYALRLASGVVTARAMVNSPYVITLALSGYFMYFAWRGCRDAGLSAEVSRGKVTQLGLIALLAFYPYRFEQALDYTQIVMPLDRYLNVGFALAKSMAWLYLLWLVGRYQFTEGAAAFARIVSWFPSARAAERDQNREEDAS